MKRLTFVLFCVSMFATGCVTQVGPKEFPKSCPEIKPVKCPVVPKYEMPGIPQVVTMKIRGDKVLECDEGCETVIRAYAKGQSLLR